MPRSHTGWWEPLAHVLCVSHIKSFICQQVTAELDSVLCSWPVRCLHCSRPQQMPQLKYTHLPPAPMEQSEPQTCLDISSFPTLSLCLAGCLYEQETGHKYAQQGSHAQMSSDETFILGKQEQTRKAQKLSQNQHSSNTSQGSISAAARGRKRAQAEKQVHSTQRAALADTCWVFANKTS